MLSIINLHHISKIEHKNIDETFQDQYWISALHEKLDKVARNDVWELVERSLNINLISLMYF